MYHVMTCPDPSGPPTSLIYSCLFQGNPVQKELIFQPPILAYDQDLGINASLQYAITKGKISYVHII